ncbi:MAG TPA: dethiobiotin synthase [Conexibacter sp.]|nr:dethiobiotin synthase [Conexibacter sp.]
MRGLFVSGTGTDVGKTVVAAAILAALHVRGERVVAFKPVVSGTAERVDPGWPPDHELLAAATGADPNDVSPAVFAAPLSPHLAAELAGAPLDPTLLRRAFDARAADAETVIVEGVGGLLVPLTRDYLVRDLACDLGLPLVIAASPGLGTINHTLLTLEAARAAGLRVAGVVLTPWPAQPSTMEDDNRATIARLGDVEVAALPRVARADAALLAAAGATLPLERWLG